MTDKKLTEIIETFDDQTKAEGFAVLDTMADLARMGAIMGGVSLRTWLESQHDNPDLVDMIVERAALLPPLDDGHPPGLPSTDCARRERPASCGWWDERSERPWKHRSRQDR